MRDSSSRFRWKRPETAFLLGALLSWSPPLPCLAADTYLDRSKVREAVPYGTSIEPRGSHEGTTAAESEGDRSHQTGPSGVTSTTIGRESTEGGRGGGTDQPR